MKRVEQHADVVVCGGGLAGVCAAVAAARSGADTVLIHDRPVLGGNSSSEVRVIPQGAANYNAYARETGIISELLLEERAVNHEPNQTNGRTNSVWDMTLYDLVVRTPRLTSFLNTTVRGIDQQADGQITAVHAVIANAETELIVRGQQFVDCTGDGTLAVMAGCAFRMGTEARAEFGEPHAPPEASEDVMGSSIHFRARDMHRPMAYRAPAWAAVYDDPDVFYKGGRSLSDPEGGFWWIELSIPWHTITDNETIRHELTRHVLGIWDYMKNRDPEMKERTANYAIDWIGQVPGKRESRRIVGLHTLTEQDIAGRHDFEDVIAYGGWYIDLHEAGGLLAPYSEQSVVDGEHSAYMDRSYIAPYGIPLRTLIARDVPNLLLAGRNISVTHVALGSTRVMGTTALLGQAAGTAAALVAAEGDALHHLPQEKIRRLQQQLLRDDCFLPGCVNADPLDLARSASVQASSEATVRQLATAASQAPASLAIRLGQWLAVGEALPEALTFCLRNRSAWTQQVDATLVAVADMWDYRAEGDGLLAAATLQVPPGEQVWVTWASLGMATGAAGQQQRYIRLELGANAALDWHYADEVLPGLPAAYQAGSGAWRRLGNGETLAFGAAPDLRMYPAAHIISGVARPYDCTNIWRSDPAQSLPQWIQLDWPLPQQVAQVELTFAGQLRMDYRFYPPLYRDPECPSDYSIEALIDGAWQVLLVVDDNYQRRRIHLLPSTVTTASLRLVIHATNGDPCASLYEMRVYKQGKVQVNA